MSTIRKLPAKTKQENKEATIKTLGITKFAAVPVEILRNQKLSMQAKVLYGTLLTYAWYEGACFPGQQRLMEELGIKRRETLGKYLNELRTSGLLTWQQTGLQLPNVYTLLAPTEKFNQDFAKQQDELRTRLDVLKNRTSGCTKKPYTNKKKVKKNEGFFNNGLSYSPAGSNLDSSLPQTQADSCPDLHQFLLVTKDDSGSSEQYPNAPSESYLKPIRQVTPNEYNLSNAKRLAREGKVHQDTVGVLDEYLVYYEKVTGRVHPGMKLTQLETALKVAEESAIEDWEGALKHWFLEKNIKTDYNFNHFATPGVLENIYFDLEY